MGSAWSALRLSEPRLEQLGAVVGGERLDLGDALLLGEEERRPASSSSRCRRVLTGSSSTVISLAMSLTQALADWLTMYTAPKVRQARKDMMAITTVSALPAIEAGGTICAALGLEARAAAARRAAPAAAR